MTAQPKRLNLEEFKARSSDVESTNELQKISGGVLGACHCVVTEGRETKYDSAGAFSGWYTTVCYYWECL